jgi:hypothetical protein
VNYSPAILGNAAYKILTGEIDPDELQARIARCHWCNVAVGGWPEPRCWHLAARLLIENGLRPGTYKRPPAPWMEQLSVPDLGP